MLDAAEHAEIVQEWSRDEVTSVEAPRPVLHARPCYVVTSRVDVGSQTIDQRLVVTDEAWGAKLAADAEWLLEKCGIEVDPEFALPEVA